MQLESLPNESLLDLFDYFNGVDLLRVFYGLNSRFNLLLYTQFRSYRFEFSSISKRDFDMICQKHLPSIVDRVLSLNLSEYRETPQQINLFCSYIPSLKSFISLQSLRINLHHSSDLLSKLIDECQQLPNLTDLCVDIFFLPDSSAIGQSIIDKIWNLLKLIHCKISNKFLLPTIISTSLKSLSLLSNELQWDQINQLLEYTPNLKFLRTSLSSFSNHNDPKFVFTTLTKCQFLFSIFATSFGILSTIFSFPTMPNLRDLFVHIPNNLVTGHQWEYVIRHYMPKLNIFRLIMEKHLFSTQNIEPMVNELFDSFRTSFWTDEHKWFIRCFTMNQTIYLHTKDQAANHYDEIRIDSWRSTYPNDNPQELYNNITNILDETLFDKPISSHIRLPSIRSLSIKFPINDDFWLIVPNLNRLQRLTVTGYTNTFISQLQTLLDRTPHLHAICMKQEDSLPFQTSLFGYINPSFRQFDLFSYNYYFNEEECRLLAHSPLGIQCQELLIQVKDWGGIVYLVNNMVNLRFLLVKCLNNDYQRCSPLELNSEKHQKTEFVQWLKQCLPSIYLIEEKSFYNNTISIWK